MQNHWIEQMNSVFAIQNSQRDLTNIQMEILIAQLYKSDNVHPAQVFLTE